MRLRTELQVTGRIPVLRIGGWPSLRWLAMNKMGSRSVNNRPRTSSSGTKEVVYFHRVIAHLKKPTSPLAALWHSECGIPTKYDYCLLPSFNDPVRLSRTDEWTDQPVTSYPGTTLLRSTSRLVVQRLEMHSRINRPILDWATEQYNRSQRISMWTCLVVQGMFRSLHTEKSDFLP